MVGSRVAGPTPPKGLASLVGVWCGGVPEILTKTHPSRAGQLGLTVLAQFGYRESAQEATSKNAWPTSSNAPSRQRVVATK